MKVIVNHTMNLLHMEQVQKNIIIFVQDFGVYETMMGNQEV